MRYYTYILYSITIDKFYIGYTSQIDNRLIYHNSGYENYTSKGIPWRLLWYTHKSTRSTAMELEKKLKNLSRRRLIAFMNKYVNDLKIDPDFFVRFES